MLRRLRWKSLLTIIIIVTVAFSSLLVQKINLDLGFIELRRGSDDILGLQLGLDLAGGTQLIYQAGSEDFPPSPEQMEGLIATITRRVDRLGVAEPSIQLLGTDRLLIQLPGVEDIQAAKALIGATAVLQIMERICADGFTPRQCSDSVPGSYEDRETGLDGSNMARASASQDPTTGRSVLLFELHRDAAADFAILTQRLFTTRTTTPLHPDQLAFVLDGDTLVAATVQSAILAGNGQITGDFTPEEVRRLAIQIESGRLPIDITELSSSVVAASLGAGSLEDALVAGVVGLALVLLFMAAYYRASGVVAAVALVFYTAIVLAIFKLLPVTLTLAGLAGFIVSLGMAVDANILIFERMKEELRIGRTLPFAIQIGFNRAWTSIRDGNISTLLIAGILFLFGTSTANSPVTGFAVSLMIGVLTSMFTAIFISRNLLAIVGATALQRWPQLFTPEPLPGRAAAAPTSAAPPAPSAPSEGSA